ncbi:methylsterol monooxygenase 1-1-like [Camellia sinensis]|uniref:methylsterol monooxygenase 1-1-like n=1 Tax=Camellia sinensis TaxID=4442 RepID=UPI001035608E|nr:methylsterol monooxygenase 1-1-like [Camellia sinensis]
MLPFQSIQEAESSLGRNLKFAENLWFKYSANKSDYFLYCHNTIFLLVFYTLLPLPYVIAELLRSNKIERFKIQPKVNNSFKDMFNCYKNVMTIFILVVDTLAPSLEGSETFSIGIRTGLPLPSGTEMLLQMLVYVLIEDYSNYWLHRLLHCKWGYEKIHRVHHEYTAPIGFAAPYAHWAEVLILGFASFLGPMMVPGHMITFWLWMVLRQLEAIETHSGYDFPWSITKFIPFYGGAEYHDYHHFVGKQSHSNFASVFTYCDYIYGTNKGYRYRKSVFGKLREKQNGGKYNISRQDLKAE